MNDANDPLNGVEHEPARVPVPSAEEEQVLARIRKQARPRRRKPRWLTR